MISRLITTVCGGAGIVAAVVIPVAFAAEIPWNAKTIDVDRVCRAGPAAECVVRERGRILSVYLDGRTVTVGRDAGGKSEVVLRTTAGPPAGSVVTTETWDGRIVSVVDQRTERRYRTGNWPDRWKLIMGFFFLALILCVVSFFGVVAVVLFREGRDGVSPDSDL